MFCARISCAEYSRAGNQYENAIYIFIYVFITDAQFYIYGGKNKYIYLFFSFTIPQMNGPERVLIIFNKISFYDDEAFMYIV